MKLFCQSKKKKGASPSPNRAAKVKSASKGAWNCSFPDSFEIMTESPTDQLTTEVTPNTNKKSIDI